MVVVVMSPSLHSDGVIVTTVLISVESILFDFELEVSCPFDDRKVVIDVWKGYALRCQDLVDCVTRLTAIACS